MLVKLHFRQGRDARGGAKALRLGGAKRVGGTKWKGGKALVGLEQ